ncbi:unnamed protein product [Acanthoscelides obtectus]|uniref:Nucleoporin NUP53 n=1 Tax=Acanthoscelides obtectus TaxID=200917 RepID=A0A9P0KU35_ACAOB|nr:unnamed protein product [Acanthoscelides obtectus]CAK1660660.1 Nucleoporin NUP53 [Acanthoscelides obtectus]
MEPMTLGSAPSSPASPGINPNFLPNFLMGGDSQPSTPQPSTSPGRNRTSGNFNRTGMNSEPRSLRQKLFNQTVSESPGPSLSPFSSVPEKVGPPKVGLFDTLEHRKKTSSMPGTGVTSPIPSSTVAHFSDFTGFNDSVSRVDDNVTFSRNGNLMDSFNKSNVVTVRDKIDTNWVTVFGFPPSTLPLVLAQLANCGPVVDKKIPPAGNWIHVKFNNTSEVARALSLNGKMLNEHTMIGVKLHYVNKQCNKENDQTVFTSPIRARSLRHSFVSPQSTNSVVPPQTVPQKSTGLVTKAMEYVFGW